MKAYNGFRAYVRNTTYQDIKKAWADGSLPRPSKCEACGQTQGQIMAHNEDYSTPLAYHEVCYICHMMIHCRYKNPRNWENYLEALKRGYIFKPVNDWQTFRAQFLSRDVAPHRYAVRGPQRRGETFLHVLPKWDTQSVPLMPEWALPKLVREGKVSGFGKSAKVSDVGTDINITEGLKF